MSKVIVFGPTGNVGSYAARTAAELGAKVYLAMRDTSKAIPGLDSATEKSGSFERIQADLTKPETLSEAIKSSGAKRAFFYLAHGSSDHMRGSIQAIKDAGVNFVVFLSSFTVALAGDDLHSVPPSEIIPFVHSQVEANLEDIYGSGNFVAMRPGAFATNNLRYKKGIQDGEVPLFGGSVKPDHITPGDMGRVSGTVLVQGPKNGQRHIYLYGPQRMTTKDSILEIGKILGKEVKIRDMTAEEATDQYSMFGMGRPFAEYMVRATQEWEKNNAAPAEYEKGVENIETYTGRKAQDFKSWVEESRAILEA